MRSSNKSRSRSKNNKRQNPANTINRVFDSSGPEGRVRGMPQQIIDKYQSLASDAMLAGDRVAHENFMQHSEHYSRLLMEAQREIDIRKEQQNAQKQLQQNTDRPAAASEIDSNEQPSVKMTEGENSFSVHKSQPDIIDEPVLDEPVLDELTVASEFGLVETPEKSNH